MWVCVHPVLVRVTVTVPGTTSMGTCDSPSCFQRRGRPCTQQVVQGRRKMFFAGGAVLTSGCDATATL